jgi:hypothetical protein
LLFKKWERALPGSFSRDVWPENDIETPVHKSALFLDMDISSSEEAAHPL